ncbi:HAD family hydrolase [Tenuifilum thalassicum]|uniref:Beta-phosphoglucomutase n=1 Tax=Tenuifilum thalassicum TaxID=2590900 RepID=A0A7D4BS55_9BACT|nr:HAD family phosphatase [Tenuifilum thalassicum]QKG80101.1 HAD family phosphatase [Tenuifilum thalassicum]
MNITNILKFEGFIFDMDGVIVDNYLFHIEAWGKFCEKYGLKYSKEDFAARYFGKTNADILQGLFQKEMSKSEIKNLGEEKEAIYRKIYEPSIKPLPGLKPFLTRLKEEDKKIAVASSAPQSNIDFVVKHTGIKQYIDVMVNGDMVTKGKPNPDIFLMASSMLGIEPHKCVVFEDSFSGIQAALNAGMHVVAVATTHKINEHDKKLEIIKDFNSFKKTS